MGPCSRCSRCRSDLGRRRSPGIAAALTAAFATLAALVPGAASAGTVSGTVAVEQATLRADGPKHDLDAVVVLTPVGGGEQPMVDARVNMDQKGLVFIPHVLAVQRGTTVTFLNSDNDQHNVYFLFDETGDTLDIGTWGPGVSVDYRFEEAGAVIVLCKLHLEMAAYVLVVDGPWFSQVELDPSGAKTPFAIDGVPPGDYELVAWHKKLAQRGGPVRLNVTDGATAGVDVVITKAKYARRAPAAPEPSADRAARSPVPARW